MPIERERTFIRATALGERGGPPSRIAALRVCHHQGCATVLSSYNRGSLCWLHDPGHEFVHRAPRKRKAS